MVKKLFGTKLGMSRAFLEEGKSVPVTVLQVGPCTIIQKKTLEKDGYEALQVGYAPKKESRVTKPLKGHFSAAGSRYFAYLREIRVDDTNGFELGDEIKLDIFSAGDTVQISGLSKGRGFAGVMKRWGFGGGKQTHGSKTHRIPGSIGSSASPGRVHRGKHLPGRMGNQRVTVKNLKIVDVRPEMGVVLVKGAVPGSPNSLIEISKV